MVGYIQVWTIRAPIRPKQRVYPTTYISWSVSTNTNNETSSNRHIHRVRC